MYLKVQVAVSHLPNHLQDSEVTDLVTFGSYNSTGLDISKAHWIKEIISEQKFDFFALQEHFKNTKTTQKYFIDNFSEMKCYVIPAHRTPGQLYGRCAGGLAQFSDKLLSVKHERCVTKGWRVQAQVLHLPAGKILWINSYLPTDPGPVAAWDETELVTSLAEVESLLANTNYDECVWAGDLNWSMQRHTRFAGILGAFTARLGLVPVWTHHPVDYTHVHTDFKSTTTLDHFIVTPRLLPLIQESGVIHRGDNRSRHSPIFLRLKLGNLSVKKKEKEQVPPRRPGWSRAEDHMLESYSLQLQRRLEALQVPECLDCDNVRCDITHHSHEGDNHLLNIITAMIETSHLTIPMSGGGSGGEGRASRGGLPGWKEEVEPYRQESRYRHDLWREQGRPSTGPAHEAMVRSRTHYHYAVRRIQRKEQEMRSCKLLEAAMKGDLSLLKEMKKVRKGRDDNLPECVEGAETEEEIANKFKEVYEALYNSVNTEVETEALKVKIQEMIRPDAIQEVDKVTGASVKAAACKMKHQKTDVSGGFTSDCLLHGPDILFDQLAAVFRGWMVHGTVTSSVLACAFLPLIKPQKPSDVTSSFRAIAGSSLVLKVFEKTILEVWGSLLASDGLQFGYKKGASTTQATWLVQEVVQHYLRNGSHPIIAVLDCSRAFALARWDQMFQRLLARLPAIIVRVIMYSYENQYAWARWGNARSQRFRIQNGIREGSIFSPDAWTTYTDPLLLRLRALGVGCHLAGLFMGAMIYSDDQILLAPNRRAMELMLREVELFAQESNILFSTDPDPAKSKSKLIFVCGRQPGLAKPAPLLLCGRQLPWVSTASHLGHELHETGEMTHDAEVKRAVLISKSVEVRDCFGFAAPQSVLRALSVYCSSYYGSLAGWDLGSPEATKFYGVWRLNVLLTHKLPRGTHKYFMPLLAPGAVSAKAEIMARFVKFFRGLRAAPSHEVTTASLLLARDLRTTTGRNVAIVEETSGQDVWAASPERVRYAIMERETVFPPVEDAWRLPYLDKLLSQRSELNARGLKEAEEELQGVIDSLCTT